MKLAAHPRLYIGEREIRRLREAPDTALLRQAERTVSALADGYVKSPVFNWERNTHNAHLLRARQMQTRVVTLLVQWLRTGSEKYRSAAVEHVAEMGRWEYWSWITWRERNPDPNAIFDLSYGENSTTLAIAYDLLRESLTPGERRLFLDIARKRSLVPCLTRHERQENSSWWWSAYHSNWLTVCGGGAGMLCLAMYEELEVARKLLPLLDRQLMGYMRCVQQCGGGWNEGVGYWNYGMRYGYLYWLSHERAAGRRHPALRLPAAAKTLWFPMEFSPNGLGTGFGDIARPWSPVPFHYAAAERFNDAALLATLDQHMTARDLQDSTLWPNAAEYLLLCPRRRARPVAERRSGATIRKPVCKLYPVMNWGFLADRMPNPRLYLSLRGGSTEDPHAHLDLLSFNCVVGSENLIPSVGAGDYIDTTFSDRRFELFEKGWFGKNTIVIGGVGLSHPSRVKTTPLRLKGAVGYRMDARGAIRIRYCGETVRSVARTFLMLERKAFLIVDRVELKGTNVVESRFCTYARTRLGKASASLRGKRESLTAVFASNVPCRLVRATGIPTRPQSPVPTMVRWCTEGLENRVILAVLLVPGVAARASLSVRERPGAVEIIASGPGFKKRLRL